MISHTHPIEQSPSTATTCMQLSKNDSDRHDSP